MNYTQDMSKAPKDGQLLLVVPSGHPRDPLAIEVGWWDAKLKRWQGDWRVDGNVGNWSKAEPIAWALMPAIDAEIIASVAKPVVVATPKADLKSALKASVKLASKALTKNAPPPPKGKTPKLTVRVA